MKAKLVLSCVSVALLFTSCATIISGRTAKVTLDSDVTTPVTISYSDKKGSETIYSFPHKIKVKRGSKPTTIYASANGYYDTNLTIGKKFNPTVWWNVLVGGIIGVGVDLATGSSMKPESKSYKIPFREVTETSQTKVETSPWQNITVPTPDVISSKNYITYNIESEPQDARIFWRVISSVPEEVESTDELWLGNTPFKEKRLFNIEGLTENNARDVQIEIKVIRKGYKDQTKRFSAKQVMELKEISYFFDMEKE